MRPKNKFGTLSLSLLAIYRYLLFAFNIFLSLLNQGIDWQSQFFLLVSSSHMNVSENLTSCINLIRYHMVSAHSVIANTHS
jgi:hypothetical protein